VPATATAVARGQKQQMMPFRKGTRLRGNSIPFNGSTAFSISAAGTPTPLQILLPNVGMLSRIIVQARGTVTNTAEVTTAAKFPWCLFRRIQVTANLGYSLIYDTDGFGNHVIQKWIQFGWRADNAGVGATVPSTLYYAFPTTTGAQAFTLTYVIPINVNQGMQLDIGLINLQSPEIQVYLNLTFGQIADFGTGITSVIGTLDLFYEFYDIGATSRFRLPPNILSRILMDTQPIGTTGDQSYTVPRMGTLLRILQGSLINGAYLDTNIDGSYYRFNRGTVPQQWDINQQRVKERMLYGVEPDAGWIAWDFFSAFVGISGYGDTINAINTERIATYEQNVTIDSGAVLGSGNNLLDSIRHIVQPLQIVQPAAA
jgi:hypothetical protein